MTLEVGRRWVNGKWTTDVADESAGGGGSLPDPSGEPDGDVLTVASGAAVWSPGGSSAPITRGVYTGGTITVNSFATGFLTLTDLDTGTALLNISSPDSPAVVADGTYAFSVYARPATNLTAGAVFRLILVLTGDEDEVLISHSSGPATADIARPYVHLSATWYLPAGSGVSVKAQNSDEVANDFAVEQLYVQRLS